MNRSLTLAVITFYDLKITSEDIGGGVGSLLSCIVVSRMVSLCFDGSVCTFHCGAY